jgi:integrase
VKSVVDRPRPGKSQARAWPRERLDAVRGHLPGRYEIIASLGAGTGMRQGEMGALGLADITWLGRDPRISVARQLKTVDGVLCFAPLKNRKKHEVPLAPSLGRALARHLQLHPAVRATLPWHDLQDPKMHGKPVTVDLVLSRPNGLPLAKPSFEGIWQTAAAKAARDAGEVPGARLRALAAGWGVHGTRHTFVSNCLRERIDPIRVAEWVGDTVAELLKTYAHMVPGRGDDDGRAVVDAYLEGPLEEPSARDVPSEAAD